jgi:hypothetical protein
MTDFQPTTYSQALVSYIDILGFADLIKDSETAATGVAKIVRLLTTMKDEFSIGGRIHRRPDGRTEKIFRSFNFSDLIVRTTRIPDGADIGEYLDWELFYLGDKQLSLAVEGHLVRGGISIGPLFVGDGSTILFGPALVRAYKLESEKAVYPRILVDAGLKKKAEQDGYDQGWKDHVHRGEDGEYSLDYLFGSALTGLVVPADDDPRPQIERHRKMIEDKIQNEVQHKDERTRQKYKWLALYHNAAVRRLLDRLGTQANRLLPNAQQYVLPEDLLEF